MEFLFLAAREGEKQHMGAWGGGTEGNLVEMGESVLRTSAKQGRLGGVIGAFNRDRKGQLHGIHGWDEVDRSERVTRVGNCVGPGQRWRPNGGRGDMSENLPGLVRLGDEGDTTDGFTALVTGEGINLGKLVDRSGPGRGQFHFYGSGYSLDDLHSLKFLFLLFVFFAAISGAVDSIPSFFT